MNEKEWFNLEIESIEAEEFDFPNEDEEVLNELIKMK